MGIKGMRKDMAQARGSSATSLLARLRRGRCLICPRCVTCSYYLAEQQHPARTHIADLDRIQTAPAVHVVTSDTHSSLLLNLL